MFFRMFFPIEILIEKNEENDAQGSPKGCQNEVKIMKNHEKINIWTAIQKKIEKAQKIPIFTPKIEVKFMYILMCLQKTWFLENVKNTQVL